MNMNITEFIQFFLIGIACGLVYLYLLWQTVKVLPNVKKKGIFLFTSMFLRIFLMLSLIVVFANDSLNKFLIMCLGFILIRFVVLRFTHFGGCYVTNDKQLKKSFQGQRRK